MRRVDDLKSALVLAGALAVAAASTVPLLLPSLPPEARSLPLPLPLFCAVLAVQLVVVYGAFAFVGLRLARARGLEPAPELTAIWNRQARRGRWGRVGVAFAIGLGSGALVVAVMAAIKRYLPGTLPGTLHPPGVAAALVASAGGSLGEEILFRLFALSLLLRLLPKGSVGTALAVGVSALAFGVAHAPACAFLFGGWHEVPLVSWAWLMALNGLLGVTFWHRVSAPGGCLRRTGPSGNRCNLACRQSVAPGVSQGQRWLGLGDSCHSYLTKPRRRTVSPEDCRLYRRLGFRPVASGGDCMHCLDLVRAEQGADVGALAGPAVLAQAATNDKETTYHGAVIALAEILRDRHRLPIPNFVGQGCLGSGKGVASQVLTSTAFTACSRAVEMIRSPLGLKAIPFPLHEDPACPFSTSNCRPVATSQRLTSAGWG